MPPSSGRKEAFQTRTVHPLHIELTPAQYELLSQSAKKAGLSRRKYLMNLLEGTPIRARPEEELKKLRTEVHHIGNNINQIARSANAGFAKPEDIRQALFLMDKVYTLFYNYFHS